ncbi:MAG: transglycosylase SLT domain-containing protein [Nocardioides sp.]
MSISDVTARIAQLQTQFAQMTGAPAATVSATPAADGADFAAALSDATTAAGSTGTPAAAAATSTDPALSPGSPLVSDMGTGATGDTGGTGDTGAGAAVVAEARKYLGIPYVWGGTNPRTGLDCSGLVQTVYAKFGIDLPRVSYEQARAGRPVPGLDQAQPGDILCFGSPVHHVAIYIGDHKMIEAPRPGKDVQVSDVYETPTGIRRVLPEATAVARTASVPSVSGALPAGTPYATVFAAAEQRYGVPATLLAAIAHQESGFRADIVSGAGARGLMQLMPGTARGLGVNPDDPGQAVDGAARLVKGLLNEFGGRVDLALAAYNAGPGAVHRYDGIPPYAETRRYVPAVLSYQRVLEAA